MRKLFYSLIGLMVSTASFAQTEYTILQDLTSTLKNADFTADAAATVTIRTYSKDMLDDGIGAGGTEMYGQQPITGWTAANLTTNTKVEDRTDGTDARAAGIFNYRNESDDDPTFGLGGPTYFSPFVTEGYEGPGLGVVAVWGATVQYTQEVTLAAGAYVISIPTINTAGTGAVTTLNGFIAEDGTEYLSTMSITPSDGYTWTDDQIAFILDKETKGVISLGYKASNIGSGAAPHLFYDRVNLWKVDPTPIVAEQVAAAKEELLSVIQAGEQIGASTRDAQAVYDNDSATLEQVKAAIESQQAINEASLQDLSEFFIKNPHFNQDDAISAEGEGITTYARDRHRTPQTEENPDGFTVSYYGMQPVKEWIASNPMDETVPLDKTSGDSTNDGRACGVVAIGSGVWIGGKAYVVPDKMSDGTDEGKVLGFVTCWGMTTQYTQAVSIPAGKYTLTISYYNTGGQTAVAKNLMGFIADSGEEYLSDVTTFKVGSWEKMTVTFDLDRATSGKFSVGYQAAGVGSANMPHFFIDGISLNYVGDTKIDPSLFALQAAVASATDLLDNAFNADLKTQLEEATEAGQDLVSSQSDDAEANGAATSAINALLPEINANIEAYKNLDSFRNETLEEAYEKYGEMEGMSDLKAKLDELMDQTDEALADYTMTTAQIEETIASLNPMLKEAIKARWDEVAASGETLDEALDITSVLDGLAYTYSATALSNTNVADKEWAYGDATNFKTQYGTAEVWNQTPFEITRTLTDMPAGTYTVTTRAFYRTADNATNYDNYNAEDHRAFIWAGHAKTPLTNVYNLASADAEEFDGGALIESANVYVPNSQKAAHDIFENSQYDSKTLTSVSTVLAETGDLKFGIKGENLEANSWVVWYSFEIAYNAIDEDVLLNEVEGLMEDASELLENENVAAVQNAADALTEATDKASTAIESAEKDDLVAASTALSEAIDYASNTITLFDELAKASEMYSNLIESVNIESTDETFMALYEQIDGEYDSNEEIQSIIDALPAAWVKYATSIEGIDAASDDNPIDLTAAIINPSFETNDLTGWTKNDAASGDTGVRENSNETYAIENADGDYVFNTWNSSAVEGDFYVEQTIAGLPAGTYVIKALVASDENNAITLSAGGNSQEVAATSKTTAVEATVSVAIEEGQDLTIKVSSATWFKADNFQLTYLGKNSTGIDTVDTDADATTSEVYNVSGIRTNGLKKGINIVRTSDNKVKKVLVK